MAFPDRQNAEQRGLAAAAGPDDAEEFAFADGEVNALQRADLLLARGENLRQTADCDTGLRGAVDVSPSIQCARCPVAIVG